MVLGSRAMIGGCVESPRVAIDGSRVQGHDLRFRV